MKSMTGYAYVEKLVGSALVSVEIKAYNSRFLDLSMYMPSFLSRLEMKMRELCSNNILRGKVDVNIRIKDSEPSLIVESNCEAAKHYESAVLNIAQSLGRSKEIVPLSLIIAQEGVLSVQKETDIDHYASIIKPVLIEALESFTGEREREGENLKKDLLQQVGRIEKSLEVFIEWQPKMETIFKDSIKAKFEELLGSNIDEQRILTETAALLMKYTINEEIVRLKSHIESLTIELNTNAAPGRKIDFICQELNREINTIGSKNQIIEVGQSVIEAKDALENIREQARNIE